MVRRLGLALGFVLWSWAALAQGLTAHSVPVGEGLTAQGWGIVGPCTANQTIVWSNNTSDPTCQLPTATAILSIGTSNITGFMPNAILYTFPTGVLSQAVPFSQQVLVTDSTASGGKPVLSNTLPANLFYLSPRVLNQLSGQNTIPLSSLLQLSSRSVVGNLGASAGNVSAPWVVPNSIDGLIPLIHTVPSLVSSDAVCFNDNAGTLKDCGTALGTAAAQNTGVSGSVLGLLNAALHFSGSNIEFSNGVNFTGGVIGGAQSFKILSNSIGFPAFSDVVPGLSAGATWVGQNTFAHVSVAMNVITSGATPGSPYSILTITDYMICVFKTSGAATQINLPTVHNTGDTYIVKDCKGDDATNNISVATVNGDLIDTFNGTTNPYKMNTSSSTATQANFDRAAFTWSGNSSVGWVVN